MDTLTTLERSERMSRVRGRDTKPEWAVRRLVWSLGYRYRLHSRDLPGCPDVVLNRLKKAIFIHGCFWHRHPNCGRIPKSRVEFWKTKLTQNRARDLRNQRELKRLGWDYLVVWECETRDLGSVALRVAAFLGE